MPSVIVAVDRQPAAERRARADLAERRDRRSVGVNSGLDAAPAGPASGTGRSPTSAQVAQLPLLLPEALDDAHAGDRLVDHAGDLAGALLRVPRGGEHGVRILSPATSSAGTISSAINVSGGDSTTITASETTSSTRLPSRIGTIDRIASIIPRSLDARDDHLAGADPVVRGEVEPLQPFEHGGAQVVAARRAPPGRRAHGARRPS